MSSIFKVPSCALLLQTVHDATLKEPIPALEWFSDECRKTKTKVITLANHKEHARYSEVADAKRGKTRASESRLVLVLLQIGRKIGASFFKPIMGHSKRKTNYFSTLK